MQTLADINELRLSTYQLQEFDGCRLLIVGDHDLSYHHQVELIFFDVQHIKCDVEFYDPVFQLLGPCHCGCGSQRIGIRADGGSFEITAAGYQIVTGLVFHYDRENLQPGERIAPWVKRIP
jgi:hypothetical protein